MKKKSFKTKANNGSTVRVKVIYIEKESEDQEDAVMVETMRVIPKEMFEHYDYVNSRFPMYAIIKSTEQYAILRTLSAPVKLSTFELVYGVVNEFRSDK